MATTESAVKATYEDYCATPDDKRYELLNGDLMMVPAPNLKHQDVQAELGSKLRQFIREHALGKLFFAPCDVVLSNTDVVQPTPGPPSSRGPTARRPRSWPARPTTAPAAP